MVSLGLATLLEPVALVPPPALSTPAPDSPDAEPSSVQDADEKRAQEQRDRDQEAQMREQEARDREQEAQMREQKVRDRDQEAQMREQEAREHAQEQIEHERELYDRGTEAIDDGKLQQAIDKFSQVIDGHGAHAEGALYWKAYAQNRLGQRPDALETLETLCRTYPKSRWLDDAKALEVEVRQSSGQNVSPEAESNEDLKLMAINSLLGTDPEQALPMLEKFLNGAQSLKLKERALFVLSQSGSAKAREIVGRIARGNRNPELQMKAIQDLGLFGGKESHATLEEIYKSSHDMEVKRGILRSFMVSGERERVLEVAKSEQSAELRAEAVKQLGVMGARSELYQLYQNETSTDVKKNILQAMFVGGDVEHMLGLARAEKDAELRRQAVRNLGLMGKDKTADALASIYSSDKDPEVKRAVIQAFFLQGNTKSLIQIARQEKDMSLKRDAVQKLSLMHSKESTDFMMELLNK
jgi:outer membrane protein assembly factor BamD (BamD/ComL family)